MDGLYISHHQEPPRGSDYVADYRDVWTALLNLTPDRTHASWRRRLIRPKSRFLVGLKSIHVFVGYITWEGLSKRLIQTSNQISETRLSSCEVRDPDVCPTSDMNSEEQWTDDLLFLQLWDRHSPSWTALASLVAAHLTGVCAVPWLETEASSEGPDRGRTSTAMTLSSGESEDTCTPVCTLVSVISWKSVNWSNVSKNTVLWSSGWTEHWSEVLKKT